MARVPPNRRPHYTPQERLEILMLRAAAGWNAHATAMAFQVTAQTVSTWTQRLDEDGPGALLKTRQPVNKLPHFVHALVRQLRATFARWAKYGLHRCWHAPDSSFLPRRSSACWRPRRRRPQVPPVSKSAISEAPRTHRGIRAAYPHHVWHVDLTLVPLRGLWVPWFPFALPQCWPFCWWVFAALDQHSRLVVCQAVFARQPSTEQICTALDAAVRTTGSVPRHLISDRGPQFRGQFRAWCARVGTKHRLGAVGSSASLATIERFWRSLKDEAFRIIQVPRRISVMRAELDAYVEWYNEHRPHQGLGGKAPRERLGVEAERVAPADTVGPATNLRSSPVLVVKAFRGRRHLPIVELRDAA